MTRTLNKTNGLYITGLGLLIAAVLFAASGGFANSAGTSSITEMSFHLPPGNANSFHVLSHTFDGFTSHWEQYSWDWYSHSGLYQTSRTSPLSSLEQFYNTIGNQLLLDELWIQKGFVNRLAKVNPAVLFAPSRTELENELAGKDVLLLATDRDPGVADLLAKLPEDYQFRRNRAFYLENQGRTLYVIACQTREEVHRLYEHIHAAKEFAKHFELKKGVAGIQTNHFLITPSIGWHPLDLTSLLLQFDASWMTLCGYNDFLVPEDLSKMLATIDFDFPCISGQTGKGGVMYGMKRYPDIQDNTLEQCLDWTEANNGYFFGTGMAGEHEHAERYAGFVLNGPGNQDQLEKLGTPFITSAGTIRDSAPTAMVLLMDKDTALNQDAIMRAILERRCVAVFAEGALAGPEEYLNPLRILMLESEYLEEQFGGFSTLAAKAENGLLSITIGNKTSTRLEGTINLKAPNGVWFEDNLESAQVALEPYETRQLDYTIHCAASASGQEYPIAVELSTPNGHRRALARFTFPKAVEIHPIIFEAPGEIHYPVTIWNYSENDNVMMDLAIMPEGSDKPIHTEHLEVSAAQWNKTISGFQFKLPSGDYCAKVTALGVSAEGKIAIRKQKGRATAREEDLNDDGIPEIVLENDRIRATVLLFGGRVIEYIVKSKDENLLFKLWPEKPPWHGEPRAVRAFYPYGGLEEFLGYPFIGGHIIYKYEIEKAKGDYARVRVWANVHGSRIEKTVTLAAGSPVLEARYAFNDITPSISVVGINPLFQIGPSTGPEDVYHFPTIDAGSGLLEKRPEIERYYGATLFLREGWAAGYDTEMDISLVVGYPVNDAKLLHMWNNHPDNDPTPYYYTELQPWVELKQGTTTYFTYYIFGQKGGWEPAVKAFRKLGLVTKREE